MGKLERKLKSAKRRRAPEPWEELGFASEEAMLRAHFGIPDDEPFEIVDATRGAVLDIQPGTKIEPIKDAKGNVIAICLTGDLSAHEVH